MCDEELNVNERRYIGLWADILHGLSMLSKTLNLSKSMWVALKVIAHL